MKTLIILIASLMTNVAFADGFDCHTTNGDLDVKVYNHVYPQNGTRNAAVMIISDPAVQLGRKTVAVFTDAEGTLSDLGSKFIANVDERFNSIPKGEYLSGTRIDYLKRIILDVDFNYGMNLADGDKTEAWMILLKENGKQIKRKMICERYLKN